MKRILLINGPNLNMLGAREPGIYGRATLAAIARRLADEAAKLGAELICFNSNDEGALMDCLHEKQGQVDGVVLNAGAFTHTGVGLADAILATGHRVVEVHISNVFARENFRHHSHLSPVCIGAVCGLGWRSYLAGLQFLCMDDALEQEEKP